MGRSRSKTPRRGVTRRDFLKRAGAASAALGLAPLAGAAVSSPASRDMGAAAAAGTPFLHAVASGDPQSERVMLWTRLTVDVESIAVEYEVATDPAMTEIVARGSATASADADYCVHVDVTGLSPGTSYWYRFAASGQFSPVGRTRTLPVGGVDRLRIGVVSCSSLAHGYFNAYRQLAARDDLDLVVHLGDYIYEYGSGQYGNVRDYQPAHEIVSVDDYRTRHAQYKMDPDLQALHQRHPVIAIWDDHETANNAWQGGAENHQPDTEGSWDTRVSAALTAYYEWMPTRRVDPADPRRNYRSFQLGELAELILLEERLSARSEQLPANGVFPGRPSIAPTFVQTDVFRNPRREMIGDAQQDWLATSLRQSSAQWKLIGQGVMMAQLKLVGLPNSQKGSQYLNPDQWDGYNPARERLFSVLRGDGYHAPVDDVVVLTGDIHTSWGADLTPDPNNPDVKSGGYDPSTGAGSLAVEYVVTSVTSPGLDALPGLTDELMQVNPHFKYIDLTQRGYLLLDITRERVSGEWWFVDTVLERSDAQHFGGALQVRRGSRHLTRSHPTPPA
jgi:alkaline phosphatase D